jgi:hypothetical protein
VKLRAAALAWNVLRHEIMRLASVIILAWVVVATPAHADGSSAAPSPPIAPSTPSLTTTPAPGAASPTMALMVNAPVLWAYGGIGASFLRTIDRDDAVRVNVARYRHFALLDPNELMYGAPARHLDLSVSWTRFLRQRWSGPTIDLGLVLRYRVEPLDRDPASSPLETKSYEGVARAMVGWSWIFRGRFVAAVGLGVSMGYERGTRYLRYDTHTTRESISGGTVDYEGYSRFGIVFGG